MTLSDPRRPIRGAFTALVTPFTTEGTFDEAGYRRLVHWQLMSGIDGLVPCGTTGESPTLTTDERELAIAIAVEAAASRSWRQRTTVVAGTGTNDTASTIRATRRAAELGADAALVVAPYYNRPDQRMLLAHYTAVADQGDLPVVVYNVPGRTGTNIEADTFLRLAEHPRIVAVKEASGNLEQIARICAERPRDVSVMSGDDAWTLALLAMGGDGVISVASNQIPTEMAALCATARDGDWATARRIHERFLPLMLANFRGAPNPVPAKAALAMMGITESDAVRQPLLPLEGPARDRLETTLRTLGLLEMAGGRAAINETASIAIPVLADVLGRGMTAAATVAGSALAAMALDPAAMALDPAAMALDPASILGLLEAGTVRAAVPDESAPDGWRVVPEVRAAILARFRDRTPAAWDLGPLRFRDRASIPLHPLGDADVRIVPGGTSVRGGARIEPGVVIMPPSFVNVGAWVGSGTMVDSLALVGSCAQVGARVHLSAGAMLGGVLEPAGARPVIVEDDAFVGAGAALLEGVLVRRGAVIGAGVTLTGTSRLYDLVEERVLDGTPDRPLVVPPYAVVVPGTRPAGGAFAAEHGLALHVAVIVKRRDARTDARTALEGALR